MIDAEKDLQAGAGHVPSRHQPLTARPGAEPKPPPPIPVQERDADRPEGAARPVSGEFPRLLPILPPRGLVAFPHTPIPLTIGQARSIRLIDDVVGEQRLVGLVASRQPQLELPGPQDLYRFGTIASIERLLRAPDGTIRLIVQGLARFELVSFVSQEPYLKAEIELRPETVEEGVEIEAQVRAVRDQFQRIADLVPSLPRELLAGVLMLEEPL